MLNIILIFLGAGIGGVARYLASNITYSVFGRVFPYGTLLVNVSGCFLMGFLFVLLLERVDGIGTELRSFLLIGFLGGYTTFSSFSIETLNLFESGAITSGILNLLLTNILCILATWIGVIAIQFFNSKDNVEPALEHLSKTINHEHIMSWNTKAND